MALYRNTVSSPQLVRTLWLVHALPFVFGFSFAFVPSYGTFLALLLSTGLRWRLKAFDIAWLAASALLVLPYGLHSDYTRAFELGLQLLAGWLVYRSFMQLRGHRLARLTQGHSQADIDNLGLSWGLLCGLVGVVLLGWLQIEQLNWTSAKTVAAAIVWERNPNLYGHSVFLIGALIAIMVRHAWLRSASLGISALGILVAGNREAALAWLIVAVVMVITRRDKLSHRWLESLLTLIMLILSSSLGPLVGWGKVGFLLDLAPSSTKNLLQGTEVANGDWWDANGVAVEASRITLAHHDLTRFDIRKTAPASWQRLQQIITLTPQQSYTVSAWVHPNAAALPALQGWGLNEAGQPFTVTGRLEASQRWQAQLSGAGTLLDSGILEEATTSSGEHWQRVYISFRYQGKERLFFWLGMTPDAQQSTVASSSFAGFQLENAAVASTYQPGTMTRGLGLRVARVPLWQRAWQGFQQKPWFGHGEGAFAQHYLHHQSQRQLSEIPLHAHNLYLHSLFEQGVVGLLGLIVLLSAVVVMAYKRADGLIISVIAALLFANIFDTTLWYSGVFYPLLAVAGWRAGRPNELDRSANQLVVRFCLFVSDVLTVTVALLLSLGITSMWQAERSVQALSGNLLYMVLLFPLMFWREGLYPSYGMPAPLILRKQVMASIYAAAIILSLGFFFPKQATLPLASWFVWLIGVLLLLPLSRLLCKQLLLNHKIWGRDVIIVGGGALGQRVSQALRRNPLNGLHPLGICADAPPEGSSLPYLGDSSQLVDYACGHSIEHIIIAEASPELYQTFSTPQRHIRIVQFVPELASFPYHDVQPSHLDGLLALELRSGLYLAQNRFLKRAVDILCSALAMVVLAPLLLLIYLAIKLDSPGGGFYWSERVGEDGKVFRCLKFRTMVHNAEHMLETVLTQDPRRRQEYATFHKLRNDPRVTRVGRWLRATDLDELAQLYNVLRGEMSLIGPRPYMVSELEHMADYRAIITAAKPGMSGYWQVSARNQVSFAQRLQMEAHYVRNWSIWWDIILIVQTLALLWQSWRNAKKL